MIKKTKIIKEILIDLYYNGDSTLDRLRSIGLGKKRPKKTIQNNIDKLSSKGWITKTWYSSIWDYKNKRYNEVHYKLTNEGYLIADDLSDIVERSERKKLNMN